MRTRTEKYRRYREKIARLGENRFPKHVKSEQSTTHADEAIISASAQSNSAIAYKDLSLKKNKATPFSQYSRKKRDWLIVKGVGFVLTVVGFVCLYFLWVKG